MKKFIKSLWEISVVPLALVIPWVSLALLPFQPMHNFLIGVVLGVLMIFYTYSARGERKAISLLMSAFALKAVVRTLPETKFIFLGFPFR